MTELGQNAPATKTVTKTAALVTRERLGTEGHETVTVTERGCAVVRKMAAAGHNLAVIAHSLGVGTGTLSRAMERQPDVRTAYDLGRASEEHFLVGKLRSAANKGNIVAAIFLLKARHGYIEGAPPPTQVGVQIVLPDALTTEQYAARIAARTRAALPAPIEVEFKEMTR